MKLVFPPEIIETSIESHFARFNRKSNIIYCTILFLLCGASVSLFFLKSDITIQSKGILRSSSESVLLVSPVIAEVRKTVLSENQYVLKGDTLIWLDCEKLNKRIRYNKNLIQENEAYLNDITRMLEFEYSNLKTELFKSTHARYRQKLKEYNLNIRLQERHYSRAKHLYDNQVIPIAELEEKKFTLEQIKEERNNFVKTARNEWENMAVSYKMENRTYLNEILSLKNEQKNYSITAPLAGNITNYSGIQPGSFVTIGENFAEISPDGKILAEQLIPPKDIGYLKTGMPVRFQVDAFNYNQWGLASGHVQEISNEVYLVNNQPFFRVRSSIDQTYLELKNGYKGELKKGLTVTARFKITERTLAQLIFDKTDDWLNPKVISKE